MSKSSTNVATALPPDTVMRNNRREERKRVIGSIACCVVRAMFQYHVMRRRERVSVNSTHMLHDLHRRCKTSRYTSKLTSSLFRSTFGNAGTPAKRTLAGSCKRHTFARHLIASLEAGGNGSRRKVSFVPSEEKCASCRRRLIPCSDTAAGSGL